MENEKLPDINFDKMFNIMISAMWVNRTHPDVPRDCKWVCLFLAMHGVFFVDFCFILYSTIFVDLKNGDLNQACANAIIGIIFGVVTLQYGVLVRYQSLFKSMMEEMKMDYKTARYMSPPEQEIIHNYAKRGRKVLVLWLWIAIFASCVFVVKNIYLHIYHAVKGNVHLIQVYELTYPSPIEEKKDELYAFFMIYFMFLFYDGYATVMYIATSSLGPILMLHGCGQLALANRRIMNIFKGNDSEKMTLKKLSDIVKLLQKTYSFIGRVNESFKISYELIFKGTSVILPITFYQIIQSYHAGDLRVEFITMIIGAIAISSIPCYYSDQLLEMGENVRLAVYNCEWEANLDRIKGLRTTLLIISQRAERQVAVRTMFRAVSLDALTDIYQQAYALFNVLNAVSH